MRALAPATCITTVAKPPVPSTISGRSAIAASSRVAAAARSAGRPLGSAMRAMPRAIGAARRVREIDAAHLAERLGDAALHRMVGLHIATRRLAEMTRRRQEAGMLTRAITVQRRRFLA